MLYLRKVVPFVPDESVTIDSLREPLGLSAKEVRLYTRFLGLDRIVFAGNLSVLDMLLACGEEALAGTDRALVRYLIHAHTSQHIVPPALRHIDTLRDKLSLGEARSFSMSHQTCATGLYALKVAEALLRAEPARSTALVMIGEKSLSPVMGKIPDTTVLGDAAVASLVGLDGPGDAVLGVTRRTFSEFYQGADMPPELRARYAQSYVPTLASLIRQAVDDAGLTLADIAMVLPHNVNRYSWSQTARLLGLPLDRIYLANVPKLGHCFCADPLLNLSTARAEAATKAGDVVVLVSAGQGGTFSAAVIRVAEEEV